MTSLKSRILAFLANLGLKLMSEDSKITYMILNCKPTTLSEIVITPIVKLFINKFNKKLQNTKKYGEIYKGNYKNVPISIVPITVGAPAAAITMEALNRTKAKYILKVDFCGGLTEDIKIGDIIIANKAICGDGTSPHYQSDIKTIEGDISLLNSLKSYFDEINFKYKVGPIYTTDALFRETEDLLNKARELGAISIDMETSIMYLLGKLYNKHVISVNIVSDKPNPEKKFDFNITPNLIDNIEKLTKIILEFCATKLSKSK